MKQEIPDFLIEMSERLNNENNRCTSDPFWQVRHKEYLATSPGIREAGFEIIGDEGIVYASYSSRYTEEDLINYMWEHFKGWCTNWLFEESALDIDRDATPEADVEKLFKEEITYSTLIEGGYVEGVNYVPVQEVEKIVHTCLTQEDAEAFIARKQHDYPKLYTYVESAYWSKEIKELRAWVKSLTKTNPE